MYNFTIPMALLNFTPTLFFGAAALLLQNDLHNKMTRGAYTLFSAGTINIFVAGFLKSTWKLLYAAGICDFQVLATMFLPVQSVGFLLAGIGITWMITGKNQTTLAVAPPVFSGSVIFIMMMVLGLGAICTVLSIIAVKMKKRSAMILFILAFVASMGMGAMSGADFTQAWANWAEQIINSIGQGCLLGGVWLLHNAGLKQFRLH